MNGTGTPKVGSGVLDAGILSGVLRLLCQAPARELLHSYSCSNSRKACRGVHNTASVYLHRLGTAVTSLSLREAPEPSLPRVVT